MGRKFIALFELVAHRQGKLINFKAGFFYSGI
jgi:hypothetical protein